MGGVHRRRRALRRVPLWQDLLLAALCVATAVVIVLAWTRFP